MATLRMGESLNQTNARNRLTAYCKHQVSVRHGEPRVGWVTDTPARHNDRNSGALIGAEKNHFDDPVCSNDDA
jgi:hypothetical protein